MRIRRIRLAGASAIVSAIAMAAAAPLAAQSDVDRILDRMRTGNTRAPAPPQAQGQPRPQGTANGAVHRVPARPAPPAVSFPPMEMRLKKDMGQDRTFRIFPNRVVVAGYNVGAFRTAQTTGRASGGVFNTNQGARSTVQLVAWGIDQPLLTRIADAAYADLVARLEEAGFEVVPLEQARLAAGADKLQLGGPADEVSAPADRGNVEGIVVGPSETGVRRNYPLVRREFGSFGAPELSLTLESMVVMPNLMFDFARLQSSRSLGYTASASADLQFGIHPGWSRMRVMASRRKQFLEGDFLFALDGQAVSDEPFGTVVDSNSSDNSLQQALGRSLGVGVQARSTESSAAQIDQARYEALALSAARGWNAAFVLQMRAATGRCTLNTDC